MYTVSKKQVSRCQRAQLLAPAVWHQQLHITNNRMTFLGRTSAVFVTRDLSMIHKDGPHEARTHVFRPSVPYFSCNLAAPIAYLSSDHSLTSHTCTSYSSFISRHAECMTNTEASIYSLHVMLWCRRVCYVWETQLDTAWMSYCK
jgi:hypothetical protein